MVIKAHGHANYLHGLAAMSGIVLGGFLILGATGHLRAVLPLLSWSESHLLLPTLLLATTGVVNLCLCFMLWMAKKNALIIAAGINLPMALYLVFFLHHGVPGHPIGLFLAFEACHLILLCSIKAGLTWPAYYSHSP